MPSNIASYSARRVGSACVVLAAAAAARPVVRAGGTNVFVIDADAQDGLRCLLGVVTGVARWKVGDTLILFLLKVFFVIARNSRKVSAEGVLVILAMMPAKRGGSVARFCRKPRVSPTSVSSSDEEGATS